MENIAAASTRVGVCASQVSNAAADGSGRILLLQYLISSCCPVGVVDVSGVVAGWIVARFDQAAERLAMSGGQLRQELVLVVRVRQGLRCPLIPWPR